MKLLKSPLARLASVALLCALGSCGGGGGDSTPDFSGVWSGSVSLVKNTCPREIPVQYLSFLHHVEQNPETTAFNAIVLDDGADLYGSGGALFEDNSFAVSGDPHLLPGFLENDECTEVLIWRYEAIDTDTGTAGFVNRRSIINCSTAQCEVNYTGSAYRSSGQPQPYPCCYTVEDNGSGAPVVGPDSGTDEINPLTGKQS